MELPLFISDRRIEVSLAVLSGLVPFQQHIEELGIVLAGTIQAETELPICTWQRSWICTTGK